MITEIVTFKVPRTMPREAVLEAFEDSAAAWRAHPKLRRKAYLFDAEAGIAGGVYSWDSIADAKAAHGEDFLARVERVFGSRPTFQYFETPLIVENARDAG
ncbi:hypothetical protein [Jannaschia seohaensis]|uniref:Monooxygenase n=1 Tax=Jannaschia seohaensis TaxID=475081 RepID=A0A2Y9AA55_9RHOB|nr:hypothetical protein [Jannaschia seohaensis]PWJ21034.1 hypothetical protein BCF38_102282 [Jannaschia seohaensis]SSA41444.1 hypothetical protein SAMN05421539_102282 [Jannaschia seohaensis]